MSVASNHRYKKKIVNLLFIIFLTHGFLFFIYPEDIYNINSPIRYIKYVCIFFIWCLTIRETKKTDVVIFLFVTITLSVINLLSVGEAFDFIFVLNHVMPISIYFFYEGILKNISVKKIAMFTYTIMTIFAYVEHFFFNGLFKLFADSGYRVVSIFVNPNNLGLVTIVLTVYILGKRIIDNQILRMLFFVNSFLVIFLSGSRNSLLIIGIFFMWQIFSRFIGLMMSGRLKKDNIVLIITGILFVVFVMFLLNVDVVSTRLELFLSNSRFFKGTDLLQGRITHYRGFFNSVASNMLFPLQNEYIYTDNLYFHIWGSFGFLSLFLFLVFNFYLFIKTGYEKKMMHFILLNLLLLAGVAENFIYFWPVGYFYWFLVADILKQSNLKKIEFRRAQYNELQKTRI